VFGGQVIERRQVLPVAVKLRGCLGVLGVELLAEALERETGVSARRGLHDLVQQLLRGRLQTLGQAVEDAGDRVHPARLAPRPGKHVAQRRPRAQRTVADHELGLVGAAVFQIAHHGRPRLGAFAVAVLDSQQLLGVVFADADHDQQAQAVVLTEPNRDMDTVDEPVRVAVEAQRAGAQAFVFGLSVLAQPADRRRRQAGGILTEQLLQGRAEVPG
jgi:hypothetical protein